MKNEYLRHMLSTINYRFKKSVKNSNDDFANYSLGKGSRTPLEIINHMHSVLYWTTSLVRNEKKQEKQLEKLDLEQEINRFETEIEKLDEALAEKEMDTDFSKKILQGPFSDILTHIGQISMLSRLNDRPIEGEDFSAAPIQTGKY